MSKRAPTRVVSRAKEAVRAGCASAMIVAGLTLGACSPAAPTADGGGTGDTTAADTVAQWRLEKEPADSAEVLAVIAHGTSYVWSFEYPNKLRGRDLVVPTDRPIRLELRGVGDEFAAPDLSHPFVVPDLGLTEAVGIDERRVLWLRAGEPLTVSSARHSSGHYAFEVQSVAEDRFASSRWGSPDGRLAGESEAAFGRALFIDHSCGSCHGDGPGVGPSLVGIFGSERIFEDQTMATADRAYIIESVVDPGAKIVRGYSNIQPSYEGLFSDIQLDALVVYVQCIGVAPPTDGTCAGL